MLGKLPKEYKKARQVLNKLQEAEGLDDHHLLFT